MNNHAYGLFTMARRARLTNDTDANRNGDITPVSTHQGRADLHSLSPSPAASFSSDKENRQRSVPQSKGKSKAMDPPKAPTVTQLDHEEARSSKRRRISERDVPSASQVTHARQLQDVADRDYYDPEQNIEERRAVRKDFRDLSKELTGEVPHGVHTRHGC